MFEHYIYQPFFNILVGLYWLLSKVGPEFADMGIAVIIFSIIVRILLLPLTFAGEQSEEEKQVIVKKIADLNNVYSHEPIKLREEIKKVMRGNARVVISTTLNLLIQISLVLMLYRIFTTGLEGADFYLLYSFIPRIDHINLMFLGKYDLSHTNSTLNILQSIMIFIVEILSAMRSTSQIRKKDIAILQVILPLGSYLIFMFLPAGKKLFVITSLIFSAIYNVIKIIEESLRKLMVRFEPKPIPAEINHQPEASHIEEATHTTTEQHHT
ncbi:MAG: YidC/Oxa1 family membrane protein insertase [bacterium]